MRDPSEFDPRDVRYRPPAADSDKDTGKELQPKAASDKSRTTKSKGKDKGKGKDSVYLEPPPPQPLQRTADPGKEEGVARDENRQEPKGHPDEEVENVEDVEDEDMVVQSQED